MNPLRIAVVNRYRRMAGGAESYLVETVRGLHQEGHTISFWCEEDEPADRDCIPLASDIPVRVLDDMGAGRRFDLLQSWSPDVVYSHGELQPGTHSAITAIAPSVAFVHNHYGTCISGFKAFRAPQPSPCSSRFGPLCLLKYFPRRCGGLNPGTMLRLYRHARQTLDALGRYDALLTHSEGMRSEYVNHGIASHRVHNYVPLEAIRPAVADEGYRSPDERRLLFAGRMDYVKGGRLLLEALQQVQASLKLPLRLVFAGDGPDCSQWRSRAAEVTRKNPDIRVDFEGWVRADRIQALYRWADLLVVPGTWPEPFGRVGIEAGVFGAPAAAFATGGIPDWLVDGVSGHLAPANPPTSRGLAEAIVQCLANEDHYRRLRKGAQASAQRFNPKAHVEHLLSIFHRVMRANEKQIA